MKGWIWILVLTSHVLFAQNNISFLYSNISTVSNESKTEAGFTTAPFELVNGMIIVQASVDGQIGNFILDTGAPSIVLNAAISNPGTSAKAAGIGGAVEVQVVELPNFEWGAIRQSGVKGMTLDMSNLESACGRDLMGLIGFSAIQNFELLFDYKNKVIHIYDCRKSEAYRPSAPSVVVPFTLNGHLPMIAAKIGGKKVYLGIDSGAEANLLNRSFFEPLRKNGMQNVENETVVGLDQMVHTVLSAEINGTEIRGLELPTMRYLFLDLEPAQAQMENKIDGLLGFPFFENQMVSINYKQRKICIWN